jgi:hypothetical protein
MLLGFVKAIILNNNTMKECYLQAPKMPLFIANIRHKK